MCKVIYLEERTYSLIKSFAKILSSQDKLAKSYEDRILDLLAKEVSVRHFRPIIDILHKIFHSEPSQSKIPFSLREQTLNLLCLYTFLRRKKNFDESLYGLLESEINKIQVKILKKEYETQLILEN